VISALKGRCPRPLDERPALVPWYRTGLPGHDQVDGQQDADDHDDPGKAEGQHRREAHLVLVDAAPDSVEVSYRRSDGQQAGQYQQDTDQRAQLSVWKVNLPARNGAEQSGGFCHYEAEPDQRQGGPDPGQQCPLVGQVIAECVGVDLGPLVLGRGGTSLPTI
jgi:hypothetical protein